MTRAENVRKGLMRKNAAQKLKALDFSSLSKPEADAALILAAREGAVDLSRRLLDWGASPNARSQNESRPVLSVAAIAGDARIVQLLLDRGAEFGARDANGATAMYHAVFCGHLEAVKALWDTGFQLGRPGHPGALSIYARQGGHKALAQWLDALWERGEIDSGESTLRKRSISSGPRL